jgi:hypothetical protein
MFLAHSFRLRDPWQREPLADGGVRWSRVFHRPTGLEPDDELWLVCSGLPDGVAVAVNGTTLAAASPSAPYQFNVTALVADKNRIELQAGAACGQTSPSPSSPPTAHRPPPTPFPYDVRLAVIGHS